MAERLAAGEGYSDPEQRKLDSKSTKWGQFTIPPNFGKYHKAGLEAESRAIEESLGLPAGSVPIRTDSEIIRKEKIAAGSLRVTFAYHTGYRFSYGNQVEYEIKMDEEISISILRIFPHRSMMRNIDNINKTK